MATSDMSLGGGTGFAANYTPIRFVPLMSLTGPVMSSAAPTAPEAAAPMVRLPVMVGQSDQSGSYEFPQTYDGPPIGERLATPEGRAAELQNLGRGLSALVSPMTTIPSLALTGKTPMELIAQAMGIGGAQSAQATPQNPFANVLGGLRNFLFGPQQETVPLGDMQAGLSSQGLGMGAAVFNDAMNAALASGASEEAATQAGRTALELFAQGLDPASAVALSSATQISQNPFDVFYGSMPAEMPGLSRNPFDLTAPAAPQAAETFALGQPNESSYSPSDFSGFGGGNVADNSGISYDISDFR